MMLLLLLILFVLLFGRRVVLELLELVFAGWLISIIKLIEIIFVLGHIVLLILTYPIVEAVLGEGMATVALILVALWQGYLLWKWYRSEVTLDSSSVPDIKMIERQKNADLWRGKK